MNNSSLKKRIPLIFIILINALLLTAVFFLMNYVQKLLYSDVKINLTEVVTQNKDVISSKLLLEVNNLHLTSNQVSERLKFSGGNSDDNLQQIIASYSTENGDRNTFIANKNGAAFFNDGSILDISGRNYFRLALEGSQNISERIVSRLDGKDIFVISVPLYYNDEIIGTVQKSYTPDEMYTICSVSLFSSQGYMYIINSDGYILITSQNNDYNQESDNYYRTLYALGNQDASRKLQEDIQNGRSGFMETVISGKKIFSAYTVIENIHDWYLISSVANEAVSPNANTVVKMFYFILLVIVFIFSTILLYFLYYKNKQQSNLERLAFVDSITKGNTYTKFIMDLNNVLSQHKDKQYSIIAFDIDNFKYLNNYYGFDFGDRILQKIHNDVSQNLLPGESFARVSGDHFVILIEDASEKRLDKLLPLVLSEEGITIYISAGLYTISNIEESVNLMVDKASTASQSAKGILHKKIFNYSEQFEQSMIHSEQLKRKMEYALFNREIIPFYQPKVDIHTKVLVGAEALARWRRENGQMVSPGEFIPLCEKTGQIMDLDMLIFEQVLEFLQKNLEQGIKCVPISVNFSRLHLSAEEFIHTIIDRMQKHRVPPELIEVELTESVIFDNHETIIDFVNHMHDHGLHISIDDFGSGYSSLNMLKDIPIDVLKIDKGFLDVTADLDRQRIILSSIAEMAKQLHIKVVVEGVETKENVDLMNSVGCSIAQGYYFAKPMDTEHFDKIFGEGMI